MKVVDILKHQRETFTKSHSEFMDRMSPSIKEYLSEIVGKTNVHQLFPWINDFNHPAVNEEVENPSYDPALMKPEAKALYEELLNSLNQEIHVGDWVSIDQSRIDAFGSVTEDGQWIHTDPVRAELESPFKTTIAHGFLTLALLPRLTDSVDPDKAQFPTAKVTVNVGLNKVRFPYPVRVGSIVRARSSLISVEPIAKGLELVREIKVEIEGVRRPACVAESVIRLYF